MTNWHVEQLHMEPLIPPYFLLLSGPDKGSPALANVFTKCLHSPLTGHAKMHVTSNACRLRECKQFESAFASARLALSRPNAKNMARSMVPYEAVQNANLVISSNTSRRALLGVG